jgi:transposase
MGPNTERQYRNALEEAGYLDGKTDELPSLEQLREAVTAYVPSRQPPQQTSSVSAWGGEIIKMYKEGAGPKAIYDFLRLEDDKFEGSLWAVRRYCKGLKKRRPVRAEDVSIPVETQPGEIAQVDFGYVGKLYDAVRGVLRKAWVFVMVLAYSRHMFCKVVFDQKTETWLSLHEQGFRNFKGVVETVVPDNLKAAVIRAAFAVDDATELNRSYRELAKHYDIKIDPTPIYSPEKKGKVEAGVKYVKNNFFKPRKSKLADIDDANRRLEHWVEKIAGLRTHGTTGRVPLVEFEKVELAALHPLPAKPFEPVVWKKATVHRDSRILFDGRLYPVPWRFIGKAVWVRASRLSVEVQWDDVRIASHQRGVRVPKEIYDTYLPEGRVDLRHRSQDYWLNRADAMGEEVGAYIREVFALDDVLSMLRRVQSIVTLLEKHPRKRAVAACRRATFYANYEYRGIKNILQKGLDTEPLPTVIAPDGLENPKFARKPSELLQLKLEVFDEPN